MAPKTGMYVGVGVSAGIVIAIVVTIVALNARGNSVGSPTEETSPQVLKKIDMNLDLARLITPPPTKGADAEPVYQAAVKEVAAMGDDFMPAVTGASEPEKKPALKSILDKLEDAADRGLDDSDLNFDDALPLTPAGEWHVRDMLYNMGKLTAKAATSMRSDKNREGAEKAMRAGLIFGDRLFHHGVYVAYKSAGIGCISEALACYERHYSKDFYNDEAKLAAVADLKAVYTKASTPWDNKEKLVRRLSPLTAPGDLWNLAEHDQDRAWRLDGLLWLGPAKWTEAGKAQRAAIDKYLKQKEGSADPLVAKRAAAAFKFSAMDIRTFRPE